MITQHRWVDHRKTNKGIEGLFAYIAHFFLSAISTPFQSASSSVPNSPSASFSSPVVRRCSFSKRLTHPDLQLLREKHAVRKIRQGLYHTLLSAGWVIPHASADAVEIDFYFLLSIDPLFKRKLSNKCSPQKPQLCMLRNVLNLTVRKDTVSKVKRADSVCMTYRTLRCRYKTVQLLHLLV